MKKILFLLISLPSLAFAQTQYTQVEEQSRLIGQGMSPELSREITEWIAVGATGFSLESATNTACSTTCDEKACIVGQENTSKALLACNDATADICLCVGK